jgi:hypothetical protein
VAAISGGRKDDQLDRLGKMGEDRHRLFAERVDLGLRRVPRLGEARGQNVHGDKQRDEHRGSGDGGGPLTRSASGDRAKDASDVSGHGKKNEDPAAGDVHGRPQIEVPRKCERHEPEQQENQPGVPGDAERVFHPYLQRCDAIAVLAVNNPAASRETK